MDSSTQPTFQLHTHPLIHFSTTYSSTHPLVQLHTHPLIHWFNYILIHSSITQTFQDFRKTVSFVSTLVAKVRKCKISRFIPAAKYSSTHPYWLLHTHPLNHWLNYILIHSTIASTTYSSTQPSIQLHVHQNTQPLIHSTIDSTTYSTTQPWIYGLNHPMSGLARTPLENPRFSRENLLAHSESRYNHFEKGL